MAKARVVVFAQSSHRKGWQTTAARARIEKGKKIDSRDTQRDHDPKKGLRWLKGISKRNLAKSAQP